MEIKNKYNIGDKFYRYNSKRHSVEELEIFMLDICISEKILQITYSLSISDSGSYDKLTQRDLRGLARTRKQCIERKIKELQELLPPVEETENE